MKAILISIRPQWVAKILNGEKTIEIRKKFPKDYIGWVYIYCTKDKKYANLINRGGFLTGMVVVRFWCDKVEPAYKFYVEELCQLACTTEEELYKYAGGWFKTDDLFAIHITKLEIFDEPKEIEFLRPQPIWKTSNNHYYKSYQLTRVPQSWCYIEV